MGGRRLAATDERILVDDRLRGSRDVRAAPAAAAAAVRAMMSRDPLTCNLDNHLHPAYTRMPSADRYPSGEVRLHILDFSFVPAGLQLLTELCSMILRGGHSCFRSSHYFLFPHAVVSSVSVFPYKQLSVFLVGRIRRLFQP